MKNNRENRVERSKLMREAETRKKNCNELRAILKAKGLLPFSGFKAALVE